MKRRSSCAGYTLLELLVVFSVSSVLLGLTVGWIQQSMKFAGVVRNRQHAHHSLLRLGSQLREDVQRGQSLEMQGESDLVIVSHNDLKTTYAIQPDRITRIVSQGDQVTSQDAFSYAPTSRASWDTSELPETVTLSVTRMHTVPGALVAPQAALPQPGPLDLEVRSSVNRYPEIGKVQP